MKSRGKRTRSAGTVVETLQQLRRQRGVTQADLADVLMVTQAALSKLERRSDVKITSLRSFVEALGGELSITATFGDRSIGIELPSDPTPASR